jgi:hypothetical protein
MRVFAAAFLVLCLVACDGQTSPSGASSSLAFRRQPPKEIAESSESEQFQDIVLAIASARRASNAIIIEATGLHRRTPVGLRIAISSNAAGESSVRFESTGPRSDAFLASLGELYQAHAAARMRPSATFDVIPLKGAPAAIAAQELKLKLFCHTQSDDQYCELYLNTNFPAGTVEIAEKDPGYRSAVLSWLGQSSPDA